MYIIEIMLLKNSMKVLCFVDLIKNLNWLRPRHFTKNHTCLLFRPRISNKIQK